MAVPNHFDTVQAVYDSKHYELTTKAGCGRFRADVALALYQRDPQWGDLVKLPGQNQWQGCAVDAVLWRGTNQAVDIIYSGESTRAVIQWHPDIPRPEYADRWQTPTGDTFQLQAHTTRLGASLFWLLAGYRDWPSQLRNNLAWLRDVLHVDYIRAIAATKGQTYSTPGGPPADPWQYAGAYQFEPDFYTGIAQATDYVYGEFGFPIAWTLVGEAAAAPSLSQLCDGFIQIARGREHKIELVECWNEYNVTGGNHTTIRYMAERLRAGLGSSFPIALDTPAAAMEEPTEHQDHLPAEVTAFYGGSAANVITPQWCRSFPNPRRMGPDTPAIIYSHEPRGPGASAGGDVSDPLMLTHDYVQAVLTSHAGYLLHTSAGVWGGHCHEAWPTENDYPNIYDHPGIEEIARCLVSVKDGVLPDAVEEPPMPQLKSRDQFYTEFRDVNAFYGAQNGLKRIGNMVIDSATPPYADAEAMGAWGYDLMTGRTPEQVKHDICASDEWKTKHPGEAPPF